MQYCRVFIFVCQHHLQFAFEIISCRANFSCDLGLWWVGHGALQHLPVIDVCDGGEGGEATHGNSHSMPSVTCHQPKPHHNLSILSVPANCRLDSWHLCRQWSPALSIMDWPEPVSQSLQLSGTRDISVLGKCSQLAPSPRNGCLMLASCLQSHRPPPGPPATCPSQPLMQISTFTIPVD